MKIKVNVSKCAFNKAVECMAREQSEVFDVGEIESGSMCAEILYLGGEYSRLELVAFLRSDTPDKYEFGVQYVVNALDETYVKSLNNYESFISWCCHMFGRFVKECGYEKYVQMK